MKKALISIMSLVAVGALVACGGNNAEGKNGDEEENQHVLEFRPVTTGAGSTSTDVAVTVGSYSFKFGIDLEKDKTLTFYGNCEGKAQQGGGPGGPMFALHIDDDAEDEPTEPGDSSQDQPGGDTSEQPGDSSQEQPGGGGFPGGDFPGGPGGDTSEPGGQGGDTSEQPSTSQEEEDFTKKNFKKSGTWATDDYGYILTIEQDVFHVDYMINQYRHDFNMNVKVDDASALVHFTAYDDSFKAKDETTYAERNAEYVFQASSDEFLFLEKGGSVVTSTYQGVSRTQTLPADQWKLENNVLFVGNAIAEASINAAHPGYKLSYNGMAYFCSTKEGVSPLEMSNADIYGETELALKGSYSVRQGPRSTNYEVELDLFKTGLVKFFSNGAEDASKAGTWTKVGNVYTVIIANGEPAVLTPDDNGVYSYTLVISSQGGGFPGGQGGGSTEVILTGKLSA